MRLCTKSTAWRKVIKHKHNRDIGVENYIQFRMLFQQRSDTMTIEQLEKLLSRVKHIRKLVTAVSEIDSIDDLIDDIETKLDGKPITKKPERNKYDNTLSRKIDQIQERDYNFVTIDWSKDNLFEHVEMTTLKIAIKRYRGNCMAIARKLGWSDRTVRNKIIQYDLHLYVKEHSDEKKQYYSSIS